MEEAENGRWMSHEHLYEWLILAIDDQQKKLKTLHDARPTTPEEVHQNLKEHDERRAIISAYINVIGYIATP